MTTECIVLDIGNTNTKAACIDTARMSEGHCTGFPTADIEIRLGAVLNSEPFISRQTVYLCSVVPEATMAAVRACTSRSVRILAYGTGFPLAVEYEDPGTVGVDRLANAVYCAYTCPDSNVIAVSAGTAITIDLVRADRTFIAGAILAGPALQLSALGTRTARLPSVRLSDDGAHVPSRSTEEGLRAGALLGTAGAIEKVVDNLRRSVADECSVYATGGAWHQLKPVLSLHCRLHDSMTRIGAALWGTGRESI